MTNHFKFTSNISNRSPNIEKIRCMIVSYEKGYKEHNSLALKTCMGVVKNPNVFNDSSKYKKNYKKKLAQ